MVSPATPFAAGREIQGDVNGRPCAAGRESIGNTGGRRPNGAGSLLTQTRSGASPAPIRPPVRGRATGRSPDRPNGYPARCVFVTGEGKRNLPCPIGEGHGAGRPALRRYVGSALRPRRHRALRGPRESGAGAPTAAVVAVGGSGRPLLVDRRRRRAKGCGVAPWPTLGRQGRAREASSSRSAGGRPGEVARGRGVPRERPRGPGGLWQAQHRRGISPPSLPNSAVVTAAAGKPTPAKQGQNSAGNPGKPGQGEPVRNEWRRVTEGGERR